MKVQAWGIVVVHRLARTCELATFGMADFLSILKDQATAERICQRQYTHGDPECVVVPIEISFNEAAACLAAERAAKVKP